MLRQLLFCLYLFSLPLQADEPLPTPPKIVIEEPAKELVQEETFNVQDKVYRIVLTLGGLIFVIFLISFFFKKLARQRLDSANSSSGIKILERRALSPKTMLYIIRAYDKTILIGDASGELVTLAELTPENESPPPEEGAPLSFTEVLKKKFNEIKPA